MAKPVKKLFPIYLTVEQRAFVVFMSEQEENSMNGYVVSLIDKEIKKHNKKGLIK